MIQGSKYLLTLYHIDVFGTLKAIVEKYGIDKKKLKLEITETGIVSGVEKQIMRVADVLRIDMAFLKETEHVLRSRKVLGSIVEMAGRLHMGTVTEGFEEKVRGMPNSL